MARKPKDPTFVASIRSALKIPDIIWIEGKISGTEYEGVVWTKRKAEYEIANKMPGENIR